MHFPEADDERSMDCKHLRVSEAQRKLGPWSDEI